MSAWKPFFYFFLVALGLLMGLYFKPANIISGGNSSTIDEAISLAKGAYVDTINEQQMRTSAIEAMLSTLDPHSVYIPAADLAAVNAPLEGGFDGIGVEFNIYKDTILVVSAINGGPSQLVGIMSGDKIVKVNDSLVAGIKITNEQVMKLLKGVKGTKVKVGIVRRNKPGLLQFEITRDKIPIYSVDAGYMIDSRSGYIKVSRFAEKTYDEFKAKLQKLKDAGMQNLIIDLRGNPGGYLTAATKIADELLPGKRLIVYTEGRHQRKTEYRCENTGLFENGKLIVLIDEGSASASEILSGGVQDWDRGLVLGRRSFGKGLVQEQMRLSDGAELRLTVARYYTPTGRCIQKPYDKGIEGYESELYDRLKNGEFSKLDSAKVTKNKAFKTPAGRVVYDGGGIAPDLFISSDTGGHFGLVNAMLQDNSIREISNELSEKYSKEIKALKSLTEVEILWARVEPDAKSMLNAHSKSGSTDAAGMQQALRYLKSLMARINFGEEGYYYIYNKNDKAILKALDVFNSESNWRQIQ